MDTPQLSAFVSIAELGSFSLAASQLGLTQSAISKRIALLETELAQPLFDRINRRIQLTEAGQALLPRAQRILQEVKDTTRYMSDMQGMTSGSLSIATSHHIGLHRLPAILKRFTQAYPDVHLQISFIDSEQASAAVIEGEYDLALMTLPQLMPDEDENLKSYPKIQHHTIWADPLAFAANHQHPLAKKVKQKQAVNLADLANYPAILPDLNTHTTRLIQTLFHEQKQSLTISMTTNHLDAINMMISVGLGWSVLPLTLMNKHITQLPIKGTKLVRQLGCIHHRERTLSNAARAMLSMLRKN